MAVLSGQPFALQHVAVDLLQSERVGGGAKSQGGPRKLFRPLNISSRGGGGAHEVTNGLLLRTDVGELFGQCAPLSSPAVWTET